VKTNEVGSVPNAAKAIFRPLRCRPVRLVMQIAETWPYNTRMLPPQQQGPGMRVQTVLATAWLGLAVVLACSGTADAGDPSRGRALSQGWCAECHGVLPDEGSHNAEAPRFVDIAAEPSVTEYSIRVFLRTPHPTMPNFVLKPDDIEDIASYIVSLKPRR